nr:VanW family protein [Polycladospora coralii]
MGQLVIRGQLDDWLDVIYAHLDGKEEIPVADVRPILTTEQLGTLKQKHLATYQTVFNPYNRNRKHNIDLSVQAIDHVVVQPGEIFSFNKRVGPRSAHKGYRSAKIIVRGEYSEGIGGGICQTSSTLFNAVDRAGLEIKQRASHSKQVTYVPLGRDATVSWHGPDFKFQNQLNQPILVSAMSKYGRLTISIYGPQNIVYHTKRVPSAPYSRVIEKEIETIQYNDKKMN